MKKLLFILLAMVGLTLQAQTPRATVKSWFETGDKPTQAQYWALINSYFSLVDDSVTTNLIKYGAVNLSKLAANSVNSSKVVDSSLVYNDMSVALRKRFLPPISSTDSLKVTSNNGTDPLWIPVDSLIKYLHDIQYIDFDTVTAVARQDARLYWNDADGTLNLGLSGGQVTLQIGQEEFIRVVNKTGSLLHNGKLVYISGSQGNRPTVALAKGDVDSTSHVVGMLTQDIPNNEEGFVTTFGYVRQINTEDYAEGDELWLSADSAGEITNVEPRTPHHSAKIGIVTNAHQTQGSVLMSIIPHRALSELSDVNGTALTKTGQIPVWNQDSLYFDFNVNILDSLAAIDSVFQNLLNTDNEWTGENTFRNLVTIDSIFYVTDTSFFQDLITSPAYIPITISPSFGLTANPRLYMTYGIGGTGGSAFLHGGDAATDGNLFLGYRSSDTTAIGRVYIPDPQMSTATLLGTTKLHFVGSVSGYEDDAYIYNTGNILVMENYHDVTNNSSIGLSNDIGFTVTGTQRMSLSSSKLTLEGYLDINTIAHATTDLDHFIVDSTGVIKYRTGTEVLSDLGLSQGGMLLPTGTEGQTLYNNNGTWTAHSGVYWDDVNSRLGINQVSPTDLVDIKRTVSGNSTGGLTLTNDDNSGYGSAISWNLKLNSTAGVWGRIYTEAASSTASFMAFQTTVGSTLAERFRINSAGNILIGTTSNYEVAKLTVEGGVVIRGGAISNIPASPSIVIDQQVGGVARIMASGSGDWTAPLTLNPYGGNVLIGTTTDAGYKLDVKDGNIRAYTASTSVPSRIQLTSDSGTAQLASINTAFLGEPTLQSSSLLSGSGRLVIMSNESVASGGTHPIIFAAGGYTISTTERARILADGSFLIGYTSNPSSYKFAVNGETYTKGLRVGENTQIRIDRDGEYLASFQNSAGDDQFQSWWTYGSVRRGYFGYASASSDVFTLNNETGGNIAILGGNVGIGTASPADLLELNGNDKAVALTVGGTGAQYGGRWRVHDTGSTVYTSFDTKWAGSWTNDRLTIWSENGYVGVGVISPQRRLQVGAFTGQNTALIAGYVTADMAPVLSLYRAGDRESFIAEVAGTGMVFGNTGGLANYNDATLLAGANVTISNTGNVGINETAPVTKLDIAATSGDAGAGAATVPGVIRIQSNETSAQQGLEFMSTTVSHGYGWRIDSNSPTGDPYLIFSSRANSASWTERARFNGTTGNFGISTTDPGELLQIGGTTNGSTSRRAMSFGAGGYAAPGAWLTSSYGDKIILYNNASDYTGKIGIDDTGSIWLQSLNKSGTATNGSIKFYTGQDATTPVSTLRMILTGSGNVGIGTPSPYSTLDIRSTSTTSLGVAGIVLYTNATADFLNIWNYSANNFALQSADESTYRNILINPMGGNVGIFTNAPAGRLGIGDQTDALSAAGIVLGGSETTIEFIGSTWASGYGHRIYEYDYGTYVALNIDYRANALSWTNMVTFKGNGNVGIGSVDPAGPLHVVGNIRSTGTNNDIRAYYDTNKFSSFLNRSTGDVQIYGWTGAAYTNILLGVDGSSAGGNVGIGTASPTAAKLVVLRDGSLESFAQGSLVAGFQGSGDTYMAIRDVTNDVEGFFGAWGSGGVLIGAKSNHKLGIFAGGSERVTITSAGMVGINEDNPASYLTIYKPLSPGQTEDLFRIRSETQWELHLDEYHQGGGYNYYWRYNKGSATDLPVMAIYSNSGVFRIGLMNEVPFSTDMQFGNSTTTSIGFGTTSYGGNGGQALAGIAVRQHGDGIGGSLDFKTLTWGTSPYDLVTKMTLNHYGYLGIGTDSPSFPLHVYKTGVQVSGDWYIIANFADAVPNKGLSIGYNNSSQSTILASNTNSAASGFQFFTYYGSSWTDRAGINPDGTVYSRAGFYVGKAPSNTVGEGPILYFDGSIDGSYTMFQQGVGELAIWQYNTSWYKNFTLNGTSGDLGVPRGGANINGEVHINAQNPSLDLNYDQTDSDVSVLFRYTTTGGHTKLFVDNYNTDANFAGLTSQFVVFKNGSDSYRDFGVYGNFQVSAGNAYFMGGNVGIGRTSLTSTLDILSATDPIIAVRDTDYETKKFIAGYSSTSTLRWSIGWDSSIGFRIKNEDNSDIVIGTYSNENTLRISDGGNVGIGVTGVATSKFNIRSTTSTAGMVRIINPTTNGEASLGFRDESDGDSQSWIIGKSVDGIADAFGFYYGGIQAIITSAGKFGIGTSAPGYRFSVQGTGSYNSTYWGPTTDVSIRSSEMTDNNYHSILQLVSIRQSLTTGAGANGYLGFTTIDDSNGEGMDDAGRIAIVNENGGSRNSPTALSFWTNPGGGVGNDRTIPATEKVRITSGGSLQVGSYWKVDSNGDFMQTVTGAAGIWVAVANTSYPTYGFYGETGIGMYRPSATTLGFVTNGSERMRITSGGQVLIGATSSSTSSKLDVVSSGASYNSVFMNADNRLGIYTYTGTDGIKVEVVNSANNAYRPLYIDGSAQVFQISNTTKMLLGSTGLIFYDNVSSFWGSDSDISIKHDGTSGYFNFGTSDVLFGNGATTGEYMRFYYNSGNGYVSFRYNATEVAYTASGGLYIPSGYNLYVNSQKLVMDAATAGTNSTTWDGDDIYGVTRKAIKAYVAANAVGGGVTAVTASSPLASSGGATPNITLGTVTYDKGGTGLTSIAAGSVLVAQSANTISALSSTSGTYYLKNVDGTISWAAGSGTTSPGGNDNNVQFNNAGSFGGFTNINYSSGGMLFSDQTKLMFGETDNWIRTYSGNLEIVVNGSSGSSNIEFHDGATNVGYWYSSSGYWSFHDLNSSSYLLSTTYTRVGSYLEIAEQSAPGTPSSGYGRLYFDTNGNLYYKNDAGDNRLISYSTSIPPEPMVPTPSGPSVDWAQIASDWENGVNCTTYSIEYNQDFTHYRKVSSTYMNGRLVERGFQGWRKLGLIKRIALK